jgi:hypothetical protein
MCRLSINSGASNSWNPKGLSRLAVGKLYLTCYSLNQSPVSSSGTGLQLCYGFTYLFSLLRPYVTAVYELDGCFENEVLTIEDVGLLKETLNLPKIGHPGHKTPKFVASVSP